MSETWIDDPKYKDILRSLSSEYPHGHPDFIPMTLKEVSLHSSKNYDYAAGGDPLGNFRRVASILGQYPKLDLSDPTVVAIVYAMKQVDAVLWMLSQKREGKIEDVNSRLGDVSVYVKLAMILHKEGAKSDESPGVRDDGSWLGTTREDNPEKVYEEHICWSGYSDGKAEKCHRTEPQRREPCY